MILSDEQHEKYKRNGYLVLDAEIQDNVLDAVIDDLQDKYTTETKDENLSYQDAGRIQDAWKISENVKTLALAPKILKALEEFYKRKPLAFQTLNFPVGTEQPPHSDTIHFNSNPSGFMCGVWIALEDTDEDNGTLVFFPGSHKLPEVTLRDVGRELKMPPEGVPSSLFRRALRKLNLIKSLPETVVPEPPAPDAYHMYEKHIGEIIKINNLQPAYAVLKKGQALIWAANLLHGGSLQKDKNRTRHTQVTHYFFENCRYYTPFLSNSSYTYWRDPSWIS